MFPRGFPKACAVEEASCFPLMFSDHGIALNEELLFRENRPYPSPPSVDCVLPLNVGDTGVAGNLDGSSHVIFLMTRRSVSGSLHPATKYEWCT
jgi:hypothetical protein